MSRIRQAEFVRATNGRGLPSCQTWMRDGDGNPAMRIYLRKPGGDVTNPQRHDWFTSLLEKCPGPIALPGDAYGVPGGRP